jgi:hypothetical protein
VEVVMNPDAVVRTLRHVWLTLQPLNVPMAVLGGIAMATWKCVRATRDVDLLLSAGDHEVTHIVGTLRAANIRPKQDPPARTLGELDVLQLLYEPPESFVDLQIDLLLAKSPYHLQALNRRIPMRLPDLDIEISVLACEDLILHKLIAGRLIDRVDAAGLLRANRGSLDLDYLAGWTRRLGLVGELGDVWSEAFPEEPPPRAREGS